MFRFRVDVDGLDQFILDIKNFVNDLRVRDDLMQELKEEQVERWNAHVTNQGAEYGGWKPTSVSYQKQRVREGWHAQPTLDRSGRTIMNIIRQNADGTVTPDAAEWNFENTVNGRAGQYPVSHHTGYNLGGNEVPARTIWAFDEKDLDRGERIVDDWLGETIARHFG